MTPKSRPVRDQLVAALSSFIVLIRPWAPNCRFKAVFLDLSLSFLFTAMAFETPFSSLSNEGPDLSLEFLRGFYVDKLRSFEEQLAQKLRNINLPRRSFAQPERSVRLEDVHVSTFVESFGKKMLDSEIKHSSPTEKLCYEVGTLDRWMALVGGGSHILRQNDAKDWSLLTPLG